MPELNNGTLVEFEMEYFAIPSKYSYLRYGQAVMTHFALNSEQKELAREANLFYEKDTGITRSVVWAMVNYFSSSHQ